MEKSNKNSTHEVHDEEYWRNKLEDLNRTVWDAELAFRKTID